MNCEQPFGQEGQGKGKEAGIGERGKGVVGRDLFWEPICVFYVLDSRKNNGFIFIVIYLSTSRDGYP